MKQKRRKAVIDDGMNPELAEGADFDGFSGIPIIRKPEEIIIPDNIVPFTKRSKANRFKDAVATFEMDQNFSDLLIEPDKHLETLKKSYLQRKGVYVIPQVRWGSELTYTTDVFPEKVAFLGVEKHSIVAIGTYGCSKTANDKKHLKAGLAAMIETLEPAAVLVYGSMNKSIFAEYSDSVRFFHYPDWTSKMHGKGGKR